MRAIIHECTKIDIDGLLLHLLVKSPILKPDDKNRFMEEKYDKHY